MLQYVIGPWWIRGLTILAALLALVVFSATEMSWAGMAISGGPALLMLGGIVRRSSEWRSGELDPDRLYDIKTAGYPVRGLFDAD